MSADRATISARNKIAHQKNREHNNARHRQLRAERKTGPDRMVWVLKKMLSDASQRAKERGWAFTLTVADLGEPPTKCPVFGMGMVYQATGRRVPASASLDRIDSTRGYTPDNVWIISWRANMVKGDATPEELRSVADAVAGRLLDGVTHDARPAVRA